MRTAFLAALVVLLAPPAFAQRASEEFQLPAYAGSFGIEELRQFRREHGIKSFIIPAQYFYFKGVEARRAGQAAEAREFFERSAEMDPAFPDPHFSLARLAWLSNPPSAVSHLVQAFAILVKEFRYQHLLAVNAALYIVYVLLISTVLAACYLLVRGARHLAHVPEEALRRPLGTHLAPLGSWLVVGAPLVAGVGLLPTMAFYLGWLRPQLAAAERRFILALLAAAGAAGAFHATFPRLIAAMDPAEPVYTAALAQDIGYSDRLEQRLEHLSAAEPGDGTLQFVRALNLKRGGRYEDAAHAFAQAERALGPRPEIRVNQGNLAFIEKDDAAAEARYLEALEQSPRSVEAHFNLAQVYTRRLDFVRADEELNRANDLDYRRVAEMARVAETAPHLAVMDASLAPGVFWSAALARGTDAARPPELLAAFAPRGRLDLIFPVTLLLWLAGVLVARRTNSYLATIGCTNCGRVVCRRCVRRVEGHAYCQRCGEALAGLRSPDYSALLLDRLIEREGRGLRIATGIAAAVFPGMSFALSRRLWAAWGLAAWTAALLVFVLHRGLVIDAYPVLFYQEDFATRIPFAVGATILLYCVSLWASWSSATEQDDSALERKAA